MSPALPSIRWASREINCMNKVLVIIEIDISQIIIADAYCMQHSQGDSVSYLLWVSLQHKKGGALIIFIITIPMLETKKPRLREYLSSSSANF